MAKEHTAKLNILGTEYTLTPSSRKGHPHLEKVNGYVRFSGAEIIYDNEMPNEDVYIVNQQENELFNKRVLRHEIIHAFFYESGLGDSKYNNDEELVDWIAIQFPKMLKAFEKVEAI